MAEMVGVLLGGPLLGPERMERSGNWQPEMEHIGFRFLSFHRTIFGIMIIESPEFAL